MSALVQTPEVFAPDDQKVEDLKILGEKIEGETSKNEKEGDEQVGDPTTTTQPDLGGRFEKTCKEIDITYWFMNGSKVQRDKVADAIQERDCYANVNFKEAESLEASNVRVQFDPADGGWSYAGRGNENVSKDQATMNLAWLDDSNAESSPNEKAIILHEFGHVLGLLHQHQSPAHGKHAAMNVNATLDLYRNKRNWSDEQIYSQVINAYDRSDVSNFSEVDIHSVKHYPKELPGLGEDIPHSESLSDLDKAYLMLQYPRAKLHAKAAQQGWSFDKALDVIGTLPDVRERVLGDVKEEADATRETIENSNPRALETVTRELAHITAIEEAKLPPKYTDAVVRGHSHAVRSDMGHLDIKSTAESLQDAKDSLRESALSSLYTPSKAYPVAMLPADWFEGLDTDFTREGLSQDPELIMASVKAKAQLIDTLESQIANLRSFYNGDPEMSKKLLEVAAANYEEAKTAPFRKDNESTIAAAKLAIQAAPAHAIKPETPLRSSGPPDATEGPKQQLARGVLNYDDADTPTSSTPPLGADHQTEPAQTKTPKPASAAAPASAIENMTLKDLLNSQSLSPEQRDEILSKVLAMIQSSQPASSK